MAIIIPTPTRGRPPKYVQATKDRCLSRIARGETQVAVAKTEGIPRTTLRVWVDEALKQQNAPAVTATEADTLNTEKPVHKPIEHDSTFGSSAQEGAQPVTEEV